MVKKQSLLKTLLHGNQNSDLGIGETGNMVRPQRWESARPHQMTSSTLR